METVLILGLVVAAVCAGWVWMIKTIKKNNGTIVQGDIGTIPGETTPRNSNARHTSDDTPTADFGGGDFAGGGD